MLLLPQDYYQTSRPSIIPTQFFNVFLLTLHEKNMSTHRRSTTPNFSRRAALLMNPFNIT